MDWKDASTGETDDFLKSSALASAVVAPGIKVYDALAQSAGEHAEYQGTA